MANQAVDDDEAEEEGAPRDACGGRLRAGGLRDAPTGTGPPCPRSNDAHARMLAWRRLGRRWRRRATDPGVADASGSDAAAKASGTSEAAKRGSDAAFEPAQQPPAAGRKVTKEKEAAAERTR